MAFPAPIPRATEAARTTDGICPPVSGHTADPDRRPPQTETRALVLTVNGERRAVNADIRSSLLDVLREQLRLTGAKRGCDQGACGACTILLGGRRVLSCLTLAVRHDGESITTVEGLASGDRLHPVQVAFVRHDAFQCGFCTPGQIVSAVGLLAENPEIEDAEVPEQMSGNLCRCAAYPGIRAAIAEARGAC